ncbi:SGNH/GDSL hydrolase family protein [uncultured Jatrophihabitans sp.]|uniref:SGNH/GDSL hydrolase family protein n=1 Tax=uncultured Jatrophihabitans sp. TaxID=1610747 RepID=UPI0035CC6CA5
MLPRNHARRAVVIGVGLGSASAGAVGALIGVLHAETRLARRRIPQATEPPPPTDDTIWAADGVGLRRPPIRIAMLGDSTAAGYGVRHNHETPAAQIALGISEAARRPVHVTNVAVVGAQSRQLPGQVAALNGKRPELVVIMVGANDVTARIPPDDAVPHLAEGVRALVELGCEVVVGTCPDLGTIRPLAQPLRAYARRLSRQMARAQTVAAVEAGGRTVSLGDLLGPMFMQDLGFFSEDLFHPSAAGYAEAAQSVLPSALDALGLRTRVRSASVFTTRRVKPVARAAAQAAVRPGSEVAGAERFGRTENRRGALAQLRRRVPRPRPRWRRRHEPDVA